MSKYNAEIYVSNDYDGLDWDLFLDVWDEATERGE